MAIFFHIHDYPVCKYVCHPDCAEYDGTCTNCIEFRIGVNRGKVACVHFKGHISEADVIHLVEQIMHAHT